MPWWDVLGRIEPFLSALIGSPCADLEGCAMSETAQLYAIQYLAKGPPGHQSLHQAPHPTVPELFLGQRFLGINFTEISVHCSTE